MTLQEMKTDLVRMEMAAAHAKAHPETGMSLLGAEIAANLRAQVDLLEGQAASGTGEQGKAYRAAIAELDGKLTQALNRAEHAEAEVTRLTADLAQALRVRPEPPLYPLVSASGGEEGGL